MRVAHVGQVEVLRANADAMRQERDTANARANRAETAIAGERQRADGLRDRLNPMQEQLSDAHTAYRQRRLPTRVAGLCCNLLLRTRPEGAEVTRDYVTLLRVRADY